MADVSGDRTDERSAAPRSLGRMFRYIGPGLIVAATGVGAGDMVSSLSAGTNFGTVLVWAIVIGALLKFVLTEALGRWYMATGETILEGWRSLGWWAMTFFIVYLFVVTFVFGAAATSTASLAVTAAFPNGPPLWVWAIIHGVVGGAIVGIGRYKLFERVMAVFVALMFVTVVGLAIFLGPNFGELITGTIIPRLPDEPGALLGAIAIIGGVGGTFTLAAYPYWVRERGWRHSTWIPTMRLDLIAGYVMTGLFMVSMLVVGAQLLFAQGEGISGESGLVALSDPIANRFGTLASILFLLGFWAAAASSIIGAWNGAAYLFADFVWTVRGARDQEADSLLSEKGWPFRLFLVWITFPPMLLLGFDQPVFLVILYASLGAIFMPFLAITFLWLLNSRRIERAYRNGWLANIFLGACVLLFLVIGINQLVGLF